VQSEEACNYDYDDHDADDVKNVHCVLRLRHARLQYEVTALLQETPWRERKFHISLSHPQSTIAALSMSMTPLHLPQAQRAVIFQSS
jgi:hypothetical protein